MTALEAEEKKRLGDVLSGRLAYLDLDIDSVEEVRELRERDRARD